MDTVDKYHTVYHKSDTVVGSEGNNKLCWLPMLMFPRSCFLLDIVFFSIVELGLFAGVPLANRSHITDYTTIDLYVFFTARNRTTWDKFLPTLRAIIQWASPVAFPVPADPSAARQPVDPPVARPVAVPLAVGL
jgi:hypothetical protein